MPKAVVKYVSVEPNKFNEAQTSLNIGFQVDGGEKLIYMRYIVAGGTEGQQKFASMQLSKLLKGGGPVDVEVKTNDRGYPEVYADDGFRSGAAVGGEVAGF